MREKREGSEEGEVAVAHACMQCKIFFPVLPKLFELLHYACSSCSAVIGRLINIYMYKTPDLPGFRERIWKGTAWHRRPA